MSLKLGKLDVRCENISQFCPEGAFLMSMSKISSGISNVSIIVHHPLDLSNILWMVRCINN